MRILFIFHIYLKLRIFVFVHTRRHKHGPALHLSPVQLQGFGDRHCRFKLYVAVAFEVPFVAEDRSNLFDGTTGLKQSPELCLWLLQRVCQVADENAAVVVAKLRLVISLLGPFSARWRRFKARGSVPPKESRLSFHVFLFGLVPISSVPFRSLICHGGKLGTLGNTYLKGHFV